MKIIADGRKAGNSRKDMENYLHLEIYSVVNNKPDRNSQVCKTCTTPTPSPFHSNESLRRNQTFLFSEVGDLRYPVHP